MKRRITVAAVLVALAAAGLATYSLAASSDGQTINACVGADGKLALADGGCKKNETPLSWSTVGPQGPQGPAGAQGPAGPQGPAGASAAAPDSLTATLQATGARQGSFSQTPIALSALTHEIVSPTDIGSGQATGKRIHKPITVTMRFDKSTPLFLQALVTNEDLTQVLIALLKADGSTEATIALHHARITDYVEHGSNVQFSFVYESIQWTDDGNTAQDDLNDKG